MSSSKKNSSLGINPLASYPQASGIFHKTDPDSLLKTKNQENRINKPESINQNQERRFLVNSEKEKVNMRLPLELVDWLDELVKNGKRLHGQKIGKEIWIQAAVELLHSAPLDWQEIDSVETLRGHLESLSSQLRQ